MTIDIRAHVRPYQTESGCAYEYAADRLIFDARPPKGALLLRGNGAAFDWTILERVQTKTPCMLSGGLGIHNVEETLAITRPHGLESVPGVKDVDLIGHFVSQSRSAYARLGLGSGAGNP